MKILLSAYACEPNKGSEPGVGWNWAIGLSKYYKVWVITRDNNKFTIENYLENNSEYRNNNLYFIYVGLSKKWTFWKKGRKGIRLYNMLWQKKATKIALKLHAKIHFDIVQHVTFASYTQLTYMYKLDIPMIWGPISGGENIPSGVKIEMSFKEKLSEYIRCLSERFAIIIPSIHATMEKAQFILVATKDTKKKIPLKYKNKVVVMPAIGIEKIPEMKSATRNNETIKIVMAGRLIYWKAFDIGIKSFLKIAEKYPNTELHILGEGNKKSSLKKICGCYLNNRIFFENPIHHDKIFDYYQKFDLFLNTTLRDSGCMTMMEAMSVGVPCIAIASGGPGELLNNFEDCKIIPYNYQQCIDDVAVVLERYIKNAGARKILAEKQRKVAITEFLVFNKVMKLKNMYSIIEDTYEE